MSKYPMIITSEIFETFPPKGRPLGLLTFLFLPLHPLALLKQIEEHHSTDYQTAPVNVGEICAVNVY